MQKNVTVVLTNGTDLPTMQRVLWGYTTQNYRNFEVVLLQENPVAVNHSDYFFSVIICSPATLQAHLAQALTDYVVFADAHAVPREDFVEEHVKHREEGHYLTGARFFIQDAVFDTLTPEGIESGHYFSTSFLAQHATVKGLKAFRAIEPGSWAALLDYCLPELPFNFSNSSLWKSDCLALLQKGAWDERYPAHRYYREWPGLQQKSVKNTTLLMAAARDKNLKISVIVSTYNAEEWLEKVLIGYSVQTYTDFELIIADDGSRPETKALIDRYAANYPVLVRHLWHEDLGYRRQEILNVAIMEAAHEYIIMTDGDCIPRNDFVEIHALEAEQGRFLSGGYCKLPMKTSKHIAPDDILSQRCFDVRWLKSIDRLGFSNTLKLSAQSWSAWLLDLISPTTPSFNNCNSSGFRSDMIAINGYDERMKYGGPDREFGERLENNGIKGKQIRHKAVVLHLDHPRGYKTPESLAANLAIRKEVKQQKIKWTPFGIRKEAPTP
ncbi:glycosyltransferase [Flavobacterium sp.]|uniref:glycosyltransferase n=1 Tax=Flavobacterium sp. TaxID=239 RepID=UPI00345DAC4E